MGDEVLEGHHLVGGGEVVVEEGDPVGRGWWRWDRRSFAVDLDDIGRMAGDVLYHLVRYLLPHEVHEVGVVRAEGQERGRVPHV